MLEHEHALQEDFSLGVENEDDFEGVNMEEWKAFRKYLKKSNMHKKRLYPAG